MTPARRPPAWRRYLRFWGANVADDVDAELEFHVEMRTRDYRERGLDDAAARRAALDRVGSLGAARDECLAIGRDNERRQRRATLAESVATDVRYAFRSFTRTPGWSAVAVITIALGIGASTAVFSTVDRLLIHPVDYPGAARIVTIRREIHLGDMSALQAPTHDVVTAWRAGSRSLEAVEEFGRRDVSPGDGDESQSIHAATIGAGFFEFAGVRPVIGRAFTEQDATSAAPTSIILAESFWRTRFGGAIDVLGKTLRVNDQLLTIVGVAPARLRLPDLDASPPDVWLPLTASDRRAGAVARLAPRVSPETAERDMNAVLKRAGLDAPYPGSTVTTKLIRPGDTLGFRRALTMLAGAVAMLLLVACANVAHLLLARGATRERELAVRYALGAGRSRLVQQMLCETLVLALVGGLFAALVGAGALQLVNAFRPASLVALNDLSFDRRFVAIAGALALATGTGVGLLTGLRSARHRLGESLRAGGSAGTTRTTSRLRSSLVVSEIALSATLLVAALLLVRGVVDLENTRTGFDDRNLYGLTFSLRGSRFGSVAERDVFARDLLTLGARIPGVTAVSLAEVVPPNSPYIIGAFETPERPAANSESMTTVAANSVAPDYFATLGISLAAGRTFTPASGDANEVVINQVLAAHLWPDGSAIGQRFRVASSGPGDPPGAWWTVVGVTRNSLSHGLRDGRGHTGAADPQMESVIYSPLQTGLERGRLTLIVRTQAGVDPSLPLRRLGAQTRGGASPPVLTDVARGLRDSLAEPRFAMLVLTAFAVLGVMLAAIGLYGVISFTVSRRTREIGIRMTLGATRGGVARLVMGDGLRLSVIGVGLGILGAAAATRIIQRALYGIAASDPWSFVLGAAGLIGVSIVACLIPMARATSVDPVVAVRAD